MKKRGLKRLAIFLLLVCSVMFSVSAIEITLNEPSNILQNVANVRINQFKYEPYPVEPGEVFDLWVKIQNMGAETAADATCKLVPEYPFSLYKGDLVQSYGSLGSKETAVFQYNIKVDENAVDGDHELIIKCSNNPAAGLWLVENVTIRIQTRYPTLNIVGLKTEPEFVEPGQEAKLLFTLENMADSSMKDIIIKLNFDGSPIAPSGEIGEKKLRRLNPGEQKDIAFSILALPNADGGIYKLPVFMTYTDDLGTAYSVNGTIAVEINSKPDLYIVIDSTTLTRTSRKGEVSIKIVNKGLTDLKFMDIRLMDSKEIDVISADTVYIGDVDSDDFETADFIISAKKSEVILPLNLTYRDISNNIYNEEIDVKFKLPPGKGVNWVVIIIVMLLIFTIYKKRKFIWQKLKNLFS